MKRILFATLFSLSISTSAMACELEIGHAWAKPTLAGKNMSAAFFDATNTSDKDCTITATFMQGVNTEIHDMIEENGVFKMRKQEAVTVPAGKTLQLKPGGMHVMLMDVEQPLKEGDMAMLTLQYADDSVQDIDVHVMQPPATPAQNQHEHQH